MGFGGKIDRRGSSGRVPDNSMEDYNPYIRINITLPQDLNDRLINFCDTEERAKSWVIQKALDKWLGDKGF